MKFIVLSVISALFIDLIVLMPTAFGQTRGATLAVCIEKKTGHVNAKSRCSRKEIRVSATNLLFSSKLAPTGTTSRNEINASEMNTFGNSGTNITSFSPSSTGMTTELTGSSISQHKPSNTGVSTSSISSLSAVNLGSCYQTTTANSSRNSSNNGRISVAIVCRSQNDLPINDQFISNLGTRAALTGKLLILNPANLPYGVDYEFIDPSESNRELSVS